MAFTKYATLESAQVLGVKGSQERVHTATLDKFSDFDQYRTEDGYLYARIRAISSRVNKNHDGWPSVELAGNKEIFDRHLASESSFTVAAEKGAEFGYSTFLGKPVFVDHHNSDPDRARGVIVDAKLHVEDAKTSGLDSYYSSAPDNHLPPTWVELLLEVDAKTFPRLAKAILAGNDDAKTGIDGFSMGCDVEKTQCNICAKFAFSPDDYCEHIRLKGAHFDHIGKDGKKTSKKSYEDCYGIKFFEISAVFDPADETALTRELIHDLHKEGSKRSDSGRGFPATEHPLGPHTGKGEETQRTAALGPHLPDEPYGRAVEPCPNCGGHVVEERDGAHCENCGWAAGYDEPDRHEDMDPRDAKVADDSAAYEKWLEENNPKSPAEARECPRCHAGGIAFTENGRHCSNCGYDESEIGGTYDPDLGRDSNMKPIMTSRRFASTLKQAMTAKDFRLVADLIASAPIQEDDRIRLAQHAAGYLAQTNPNFDQQRFLEAATGNPGGRDQFGGGKDYPAPPPEILGKTAEAPLPQADQLHAPQELNTLRDEHICPVCGSTMDDETCDLCGYVEPPDGFDNPDLEKAKGLDEMGDIGNEVVGEPEGIESNPAPEMPDPDIANARNNLPTASVKNDMAKWNISFHPKVAGRINTVEDPITTSTDAATDEPKEEILKDETAPTTARTAKEFIAAADRKENNMSKQAADSVPAAKPDKRVEVDGVGGADQASNEEASKADGQVDLDSQGGTGVEDVSADEEGVNVAQGDEHSKNIEEIPTKTWSGDKRQTDPVQGDVFPASGEVHPTAGAKTALDAEPFPKDDGGLGGGNATQGVKPADPVGTADERVDVLDAVTTPENNSGPTDTWSGTDGNKVLRQQDPVTNETLEGDNIVNLNPGTVSSTHLFSAFKLADLEVELGLLNGEKKYDRVAELEKKSPERVAEALEYAQRVKTAGLSRKKEARRVPSFAQAQTTSKQASSQSDEDYEDDSVLFS